VAVEDSQAKAGQRKAERLALEVEFRLGDKTGLGEIVLDSLDLSPDGTFLQADLLFELGEILSLSFQLPGDSERISVEGRVAWASRGQLDGTGNLKPPGMGVQFIKLSDPLRERIKNTLEKLSRVAVP